MVNPHFSHTLYRNAQSLVYFVGLVTVHDGLFKCARQVRLRATKLCEKSGLSHRAFSFRR